VSGERTKTAALDEAITEFIAPREQRQIVDLFGKLDWEPSGDHKAERSRG
jgi:hypothetical protein